MIKQFNNLEVKKRIRKMLIVLSILFGSIFLYKCFMGLMFKWYMSSHKNIATVTVSQAEYSSWIPTVQAVGSLRAIRGINVTTEVPGLVDSIVFQPGSAVRQNDELARLNRAADIAELEAIAAKVELAKIVYNRDKAQLKIQAISKTAFDGDAANLKSLQAQLAQQEAMVNKKIIRAPFTGRLGISMISPGQYLNPGDKIVSLQQLDPIYIDFYVPQQTVVQLQKGQRVKIAVDSFPAKTFSGVITTIDPIADSTTRNIQIEATISNAKLELIPGMYANIKVTVGKAQPVMTLPQSAISFNSYGSSVFIVEENKDEKNRPIFIAKEKFVKLGETRGNQVAIISGLSLNDRVVTSGQLKLHNGSQVIINNAANANAPAISTIENES